MEVSKIFEQLVKIGFSYKRVGTLYIAEAVVYIYKNKLPLNLEDSVYQYLSQKYCKKKTTIKSNMIVCCKYASINTGKKITTKYIIKYILHYNLRKKY